MKKTLFSSLLMSGMLLLSFPIFSQEFNLDGFDDVDVSGSIKLNLIPSNENRADVEMIKGDIEKLILEVRGKTLYIKFKKKMLNWGGNNNKANIDLYVDGISGLEASAGSSVTSKEAIVSSSFDLEVSSGSSVSMVLEVDNIEADVSSGSSTVIKGSADKLTVDSSSGSTFNGEGFIAEDVDVEASSGSTAKVYASKKLKAEASSGSTVRYKGNPTDKSIDVGKYSGGSVKEMN